MFTDIEFDKNIIYQISRHSGETYIEELLGYETRAGGLQSLSAIRIAYAKLGFLDEKGIYSNYCFYIAGKDAGKRYIASVNPLTEDEKLIIKTTLLVNLKKVNDNLWKLI